MTVGNGGLAVPSPTDAWRRRRAEHPMLRADWLPAGTGVAFLEDLRARHERAVAVRDATLRIEASARERLDAVDAELRGAVRAGRDPLAPTGEGRALWRARLDVAVEERQAADAALASVVEEAASAVYRRAGRDPRRRLQPRDARAPRAGAARGRAGRDRDPAAGPDRDRPRAAGR